MFRLPRAFLRHLVRSTTGNLHPGKKQWRRTISALYITGDKAMENYVTLRPYMDFENTLGNRKELEQSIKHRKLPLDLDEILQKYERYKEANCQIHQTELEREKVAQQLKELAKAGQSEESEMQALKQKGRELRDSLKVLKANFYPTEDDFIHAYLNLPNNLHRFCPVDNYERVIYRSQAQQAMAGDCHLKREDLIRFIDNSRYYMMKEAAEFDIFSTQALTRYFCHDGGFIQTSNPDFARAVLLEANATPLENYHLVIERELQNKLNPAYLVGGGAFESYLAGVAKLVVYPSVLPLRFVSMGRSYLKKKVEAATEENLYTATQSNTVQTFVATEHAAEAEEQMEIILNLAVDFYKELDIHFRIVYADASALSLSECLRAEIQVYSPVQRRYICVGHVSNYADFISKRILFTMRKQKDYHFLHLVGGPVMYTTTLIAALIENGIPLDQCKLLGAFEEEGPVQKAEQPEQLKATPKYTEQYFKNLFK